MIAAMQLQGLSPRVQHSHAWAVREPAECYGKPPNKITEEELCPHFLYRAHF